MREFLPEYGSLLKSFSWEVSTAYLSTKIEQGQRRAIYCGIVRLHEVDADLARKSVDQWDMTRAGFREMFRTVFGRRLPVIARASASPTKQIRRRELEQFRQSIESWERQGQEAGRDGDVELAAGYADDVADLRAILRLIESGALHEVIEAIDCLDTLVRDQIPQRLYDAVVPGS